MAALCAGYFLVLLDVTVVNVALPRIGRDLGADGAGTAWVVDGYTVPLAALLLAAGTLGDRIGHRRVVLLGLAGFGTASAVCATAPVIGVLIAARALAGVAAALMLPGTLALLVRCARDDAGRNRLVGLWAAVGGAALPAGPVLGGVLVEFAGWRSVFWLAVPVTALAVLPVLRLDHDEPYGTAASVNWLAAVLLVGALTLLVTAVLQAATAPLLATGSAAAAAAALVIFRRVDRRADRRLLPVPARARRPLGSATLAAGLMNLRALGGLFLLTQLLQDRQRLSPLAAGLITLPAMLPLPLLGRPAGRLVTRIGVWRGCAAGAGVAAAGMAGTAAVVGSAAEPLRPAGYLTLCGCLAVWGCGLGLLTPAVVAAALRAVPEAPGLASGASNTARQTGGALGIALFAAVAGPSFAPDFAVRTAVLFAVGAVVLGSVALVASCQK